jgi:ABC-2 type transport system permease protein
MTSTVAEAAGESGVPAATPPARPLAGTLRTLVRREFWEHRYLWIAPLAVAALLMVTAVIGRVHLDIGDDAHLAAADQRVALLTIVQWALTATFYILTLFIVSYYALDCLYAERKDRSILFWKSLPVSDGLTVGSKILTALVVVPLGVFALSLLSGLLFFAIMSARIAAGSIPGVVSWSTVEWLRTEVAMLIVQLVASLWYAPGAAFLLLVSAWAKRSPFLWATLPWVVAPILEKIAFGTHYVWDFIAYRSNGIWGTLAYGPTHGHFNIISKHGLHPVGTLLDEFNLGAVLTDIDLWLGVAAAAAMLYAAVRVRRYRDDS